MGCDIHAFLEVRADEQAPWRPHGERSPCEWEPERLQYPYAYHDRNYDTFAILANVRNGYGFAGCDTGDGFVPISEPRGLPPDLAPELREEEERCRFGDHSFSWLLLSEILGMDWAQETKKRGWVNGPQWERWSRYTKRWTHDGPDEWCGGISGPNVRHIQEHEMAGMVKALETICDGGRGMKWQEMKDRLESELGHTYCLVEWTIQYSKAAGDFYSYYLPRWRRLGDPKNVRLVFGFDS